MSKKRKKPNISITYINVPVNLTEFAQSITSSVSSSDLFDLVIDIDCQVADADFTEDLIVKLVTSLKGDLSGTEARDLASRLSKILEPGVAL